MPAIQPRRWGQTLALVMLLTLAACASPGAGPTLPYATPTPPGAAVGSPTPTATVTPTPFAALPPTPVPTPTLQVYTWALAPQVPAVVREFLTPPQPTDRWQPAAAADQATARLTWATAPDAGAMAGAWTYALVAPFFSLDEGAALDALQTRWRGAGPGPVLWVTPETAAALQAFWGPSDPNAVRQVPPETLLATVWERGGWAIVPFEALEPRWKVLPVDGRYPWDEGYGLRLPLTWELREPLPPQVQPPALRPNFSPDRLTVVAMTGVTALVRATAYTMEMKGLTYPAEDIGPLLAAADITHISNEVPFDPTCPPPNPVQQGLKFCSDPRYIALLEAVGTDVVELTGDHFNDRGPDAVFYTVQMYRERGWAYYGGGENLDDARRPALFEHHGNRIAFVGCNAKGGGYARAAAHYPGAAACDWDFLTRQVQELRAQGYLPIVTFQHHEYYVFDPPASMKADFRRMAEAGAVIVSGSQAHHPHGMAFYRGALLTYGLGNLFFDQKGTTPYGDQALIALHYFYANRHISTRLVPIRFVDFAKPVRMTPAEARALLEKVFAVSEGEE